MSLNISEEEWSLLDPEIAAKLKDAINRDNKKLQEEVDILSTKVSSLKTVVFDTETEVASASTEWFRRSCFSIKNALIRAIINKNMLRIKAIVKYQPQSIWDLPSDFCYKFPLGRSCNLITTLLIQPEIDIEVFEMLLNLQGVTLNLNDCLGRLPLVEACKKPNNYFAFRLIDKGADVRQRNNFYNPLHIAAEKEDKNLCLILLEKGANVNEKVDGKAPLHLAYLSKNLELFNMFLCYGADVSAPDSNGKSVFEYAILDKNVEIQEICFNFVFDQNEKIIINFSLLFLVMEAKSPIIKDLLGKVFDLNYNTDELSVYGRRLFLLESEYFSFFQLKFPDIVKEILNCYYIALVELIKEKLEDSDASKLMKNMYSLICSELVFDFVDVLHRSKLKLSTLINFCMRRRFSIHNLQDIFYILASYGADFRPRDVRIVGNK